MNYNKLMESIIDEIKTEGKTPSVLLHSCCAPCSSHVIDLLTKYFDITILYFKNIFHLNTIINNIFLQ